MISSPRALACAALASLALLACSSGGSSSSSSGAGGSAPTTTSSQGGATSASASSSGGLGGHACSSCDGACVDLATDPHDCGRCGKACPSNAAACVGGVCTAPKCDVALPCPLDHTCCGGACCPSYAVCCLDENGSASCVAAPDGGAVTCPTSCCR